MLGRGSFSMLFPRGLTGGGGSSAPAVPALALLDRAGAPILDRSGGYILTRAIVAGVATSASVLTRTSAVTAYPPTISFTRPIDWQDGDKAVMQWSTDSTFGTGVTETATPQTLTAAVTTYNFGLSAIVAGIYYMRLAAWRGTRPGSLNWSNLQGVGDAVAPTITSSAAPSGFQYVATTFALTANKGVYWSIVGGLDATNFTISGNNLLCIAQSAAGNLAVQVQATSYFGIASTAQAITLAIAANTPSAFPFTPATGVTASAASTSNTITVAGIVGGISVQASITGGTYSKNGGAFTSTTGTAVNGDTFAVQETASATAGLTVNATLTLASTSGTYAVTTFGSSPMALDALFKHANLTLAGGNLTVSSATDLQTPMLVRGTKTFSGKGYFELKYNTTQGVFWPGMGVCNASETTAAWPGFADAFGSSCRRGGSLAPANTYGAPGVAASGTMMFAFDTTANLAWVGFNGSWATTTNPATGVNGTATGITTYYPCVILERIDNVTVNFGATAFTYTPPTGFGSIS